MSLCHIMTRSKSIIKTLKDNYGGHTYGNAYNNRQ